MSYRTLQVTARPQPLYVGQPLNKTSGLGVGWTIANNDQTNPVFVSTNPGVKSTDSDAVQVAPLGSIPVDPTLTSYVVSAGPSVQCYLMPGGGTWAPSPAQIAAQINALGLMKDTTGVNINTNVTGVAKDASITPLAKDATVTGVAKDATLAAQTSGGATIASNIAAAGVPAINLKSTTQIANALVITSGTTTALTAITGINQPAYNLHITATSGVATKPWYTVTLKWIDTASGFTVQVDAFTAFMSSTSNVLSTVIAGPTNADQLQVSITNNDTVSMTVNTAFFMLSSRTNYTTDDVYQFWTTAAMTAIPTFQIGAALQVPTEKVLFSVNRTVGVGVTTTPDYAIPVFSGQAFFHFDGGSSNNWDVKITDQFTGTTLLRPSVQSAPAYANLPFVMPRTPCTINITNNGTVLGTANLEITAA